MNLKLVFKVVGYVLLIEAVSMLLPLLVALVYGESPLPFLWSIAIVALLGGFLSRQKTDSHFFTREGFCAVGFIWLATGIVGALPFYFCGYFSSFVDCFFESCSGFTTTGATILSDIEALPKGILFWRSLTHWLGGMGVLVLATAVLPFLGIRTQYLAKAETPGPTFSKLVPKQSQTAKILYGMYCALTLLEVVCLKLVGLPLYDAFIHAFSTAGTGGFSNRNASIGAYDSVAVELIIAFFIILFSLNFALYFLMLNRRFKEVLASDELRFFFSVLAGFTVIIAWNITPMYGSFTQGLRHAFFYVVSIISTTGFGTVDFALWPQFPQFLLVLLMFCGACAGSTGGGMKCSRILILFRSFRRELHRLNHPNRVEVIRLDGRAVDEDTVHSTHLFVCSYLLIILFVGLIISLDNFSFSVSFSAALTCVSNVGPGLELIGPTGNCSIFSDLSKVVMALTMLVGRLEIFPILILFSRSAWRKG